MIFKRISSTLWPFYPPIPKSYYLDSKKQGIKSQFDKYRDDIIYCENFALEYFNHPVSNHKQATFSLLLDQINFRSDFPYIVTFLVWYNNFLI